MIKKILTLVLSVVMTGSILTCLNFKEHNSSTDLVSLKTNITIHNTVDPDADEV